MKELLSREQVAFTVKDVEEDDNAYDELLALNHIDDPRKLQIGQKLILPKTIKPKKTGE